jgi:N-acetylglucosaminyldiphosphoundecaprenol N-acetyl-beta-D-mannosaminyltransferase
VADLERFVLQRTTVPITAKSLRSKRGNGIEGLVACVDASSGLSSLPDDLSRGVFGIFGAPFDALNLSSLLHTIGAATSAGLPFLISTLNVNFLMSSLSDSEFRESLLLSDLCLVDGMPIVWIARLLGIPIGERLAGSDLFDTLKASNATGRRLKVFLFGGGEGVAESVSESLNARPSGMECVGTLNPGFGSVEELSTDQIIKTINASQADLLAVFLSASKAQKWLLHNHDRLQVPVRAQFGAVINFQAGTIERAPPFLRKIGFEWVWRIKEEPYLWRRYWLDGKDLFFLLATRALPLGVDVLKRRLAALCKSDDLRIDRTEHDHSTVIHLSGYAIARHVDRAISMFRTALDARKPVTVDLSKIHAIDQRFFGLFLMLRKQLRRQGRDLNFSGITAKADRAFRQNGFDFLLQAGERE